MTGERAMSRRTTIAIAIGLAALVAIVYAPVRHFDFVQLDDPAYVTENPQVLRGFTLEGLRWALTTGHAANWHPVTWLSHMLDVQLFGLAPGAHHVTSVLLHIANTLLLFGLLARMTGAPWRSAFVAALFGVHPLHVESVAWVAERKDVLSTLFWMLTMWAYVAFVRATPPGSSQARRRGFYVLMLALYALGLMAKPMLVTLPFALLLLDWWPLERFGPVGRFRRSKTWPLVREKLPLFLMAAASSAVTVLVQQKGGAVSTLESNPFSLRLQNALVSAVAYLRDLVWPAGLTVIYPFPDAIPAWQTAGACVVLGGLSFIAYRLARRHPYLPVGWLWYLGTLVPVAGPRARRPAGAGRSLHLRAAHRDLHRDRLGRGGAGRPCADAPAGRTDRGSRRDPRLRAGRTDPGGVLAGQRQPLHPRDRAHAPRGRVRRAHVAGRDARRTGPDGRGAAPLHRGHASPAGLR